MPGELESNNRRLVLHLVAAGACFGIIEGLVGLQDPTPSLLALAGMVIINFISFFWLLEDSKIRNYKASVFLKVIVVFLGIIALSRYVIRTRKAQEIIKSFVYALGLIFLAVVVWTISGVVTSAVVGHGGVP